MALSQTDVFERTIYKMGKQALLENVEIFNANSQGAIILSNKSIIGDFEQKLDVILGGGLIKPRNPYADTKLDAKGFDRVKDNIVKLGLGTYPIVWSNAEFNWVKQDPRAAGAKIAQQIANQTAQTMAEMAIGSVVTCLNSNENVKTEIPHGTPLSHLHLIKAMRPMGDQLGAISLYVMHSTQYYDLVETTFKNAERLFEFGGITIMRSALGQTFLITDNKALATTQANYILGLKKGSVAVGMESDFDSVYEKTGGHENIKHSFQSEWTSSLKVNNYRYKTNDNMNGLTYAQITQASNWERISNEAKAETGVIIACKNS